MQKRRSTASSASPTCRSISPIRWCAARRRCRRRATRGRRSAWMNAQADGSASALPAGDRVRVAAGRGRGGPRRRRSTTGCRTAACASPRRIRRRPALGPMFGARDAREDAARAGGLRCSTSLLALLPSRSSARPGGRRCTRLRAPRSCSSSRIVVPLMLSRGLPHAVGAQGDRLDPGPHRPEPRRPDGPAAADRRRHQAADEGRSSCRPTPTRRSSCSRRS